jgi:hypothetical protein
MYKHVIQKKYSRSGKSLITVEFVIIEVEDKEYQFQ